jgi:multidrug resistance protein MdtO
MLCESVSSIRRLTFPPSANSLPAPCNHSIIMAAAVRIAPVSPNPMAWLREFLREELAPYPGRAALVARMVCASTIVIVLTMTFQIPFGAYGAIYALTISRETPQATLRAARIIFGGIVAGGADVLIGAMFFSGEPLLRLAWVVFSFLLMFFLLSALSNYIAAVRFGYLIIITAPVWDLPISTESKVANTLWAVGAILLATVVTTVLELIYARLWPYNAIATALAERLDATAHLLRSGAEGIRDQRAEQYMTRLSIRGTSRMRRDLQRSGYAPEYVQRMGAVVALVGRLVDLAATVPQISSYVVAAPEPTERERLQHLAAAVETIAERLQGGARPLPALTPSGAGQAAGTPLLAEMEGTVNLMIEAIGGAEAPGYLALAPLETEEAQPSLFRSDAFSDRGHLLFALRGGLAATACYLFYSLVDWHGLSTSVTTCFLTALTTVGASRQKQVLRFAGAIVGGGVFGFGAQIFILPAIDSITGFLLLVAGVTVIASWIATSSPRLSYFGVQVAVAFDLINLEEFKFQTSLSVARDRVMGILLGLVMMGLIFDQLGGGSAVVAMRRSFVSGLRMLARLMREPLNADHRLAIEQTFTLRETIQSAFENLRQQADGVALEFSSSRERDLDQRARLLNWSLQLRIFFLARITLLKYRLQLPGFELPPGKQQAQKDFDNGMAAVLDAMANRLEGQPPPPAEPDPHALLAQLQKTIHQLSPGETPDEAASREQIFVPLSERIVGIVATLRQEMESSDAAAEA